MKVPKISSEPVPGSYRERGESFDSGPDPRIIYKVVAKGVDFSIWYTHKVAGRGLINENVVFKIQERERCVF